MDTNHLKSNHGAKAAVEINRREVLTLPEVASEMSVSRRFIELEINRGRLARIRLSNRVVRVSRAEVNRYLSANTVSARK